jgi:hypothetical protein
MAVSYRDGGGVSNGNGKSLAGAELVEDVSALGEA